LHYFILSGVYIFCDQHLSLSHLDFSTVCSWPGLATAATLKLASVFSAMTVACVQWFDRLMCFVVAMLFVAAHEPAATAEVDVKRHTSVALGSGC
jgi:hypothetical protein